MSIIHKSAGLVLCVFALSTTAHADIYNNSGSPTRSLYISKNKNVEQQINTTQIQKVAPTPSPKEQAVNAETSAMEAATDQVWEKYKSLAAGLDTDNEGLQTTNTTPPKQPKTPTNKNVEAVQKTGTTTPPQNSVSLTNLLRSYQRNRAQRGEIRSLQTNYKADRLRSIETKSEE